MVGRKDVSRRNLLKTLSGSSVAVAGFSQGGSASLDETIEITEIDGQKKKKFINKANKHEEFRRIRKSFKSEGWKIAKEDSKVAEITDKSTSVSYRLIVAKFESKFGPSRGRSPSQSDESEQRYITWTDLDLDRIDSDEELHQVAGHRFKRIEGPDSWEVSKSTVQQNSITTEATTFELSDKTGISISSHCDGYNECYRAKTTCDSYNWGCILMTAGAYVTTVAACGSCVFGSPSCLYCLGALLTSAGVTVDCDYGSGCTTTYECTTYCND